jgi:hypothetical protein
MPYYRLYALSDDNHILRPYEYTCDDDLEALERGRELAIKHSIEIWQEKRRVAFVKKGDAPLSAFDRRSL